MVTEFKNGHIYKWIGKDIQRWRGDMIQMADGKPRKFICNHSFILNCGYFKGCKECNWMWGSSLHGFKEMVIPYHKIIKRIIDEKL